MLSYVFHFLSREDIFKRDVRASGRKEKQEKCLGRRDQRSS